ncbi:MAG: stage VI sporulation protein F [Bacilli bacterium]|nr:stage VI sporulation protein F [Bacilli bacterium]
MFNFGDSLFDKVEKKTNINKDTILKLASKLQGGNLKDEQTLRSLIREISELTGKEVSKEKENKIVETIISDKVPNDIDNLLD